MSSRGFWQEPRRRHVSRVAVAYAVVDWLLIDVVTQVFPVFHMPDWADQLVVLLIAIGFPIAVILAWAFEVTPGGCTPYRAGDIGGRAAARTNPSRRQVSQRHHHRCARVGSRRVAVAEIHAFQ